LQGIDPAQIFIAFLVLVFSLTVHEAAHAWTADRLGDQTAKNEGRISLNPLVHIDPIGTVLFPLVGMLSGLPVLGWAKPVPVSVRGLKNPRRDLIFIAIAGPVSNIVLAIVASFALRALSPTMMSGGLQAGGGLEIGEPLFVIAREAFQINLVLAVFNMIPIPPLDGGNVLSNLLPPQQSYQFDTTIRPYGWMILYALMLTGALRWIIGPPLNFLASVLL
jgi:Zn-dependent protease